jgi:hypothetical protein
MKYFISLIFLLPLTTLSFAADKSSGCGLGWKVTKSMTTTGYTVRASTNGTFSNSFGMTSGTSGCEKHSIVFNEKKKIHFLESNLVPLRYEIALGTGERLNALVELFGCYGDDSAAIFKNSLRSRSRELFLGKASASDVLLGIEEFIQSDSTLGKSCLI